MLSINDFTSSALGIKDPNISFDPQKLFERKPVKGKEAFIYHASLTYHLDRCPNCGKTGNIVKNGTNTVRILMSDTHQYLSYLDLKKQRFLCPNCNTTTTAKTDLVKTRARIAKIVHQHLLT